MTPDLLASLDQAFVAADTPPHTPPRPPWQGQVQGPHADALRQLYDACWMRAAHRMHRAHAAALRAAGRPHLPYIRKIRWQGATYVLDDLFDAAVALRKQALNWCFFTLTPPQLADIQALPYVISTCPPDAAAQLAALVDVVSAVVQAREQRADLHGAHMPFTLHDAMAAFHQGKAFAGQGQVNLCKKVTLGKVIYFIKTYDEEASGISDPARDQRNEAAVAAGLRALGWRIGPAAVYHLLGSDGNHYAIVSAVPGRIMDDPASAAARVGIDHIQRAALAEYLLGLQDRHTRNVLVDMRHQTLREIDLAAAFRYDPAGRFLSREDMGSLGVLYLSHARAIWEAHPDIRYIAGSPVFARAILAEAVAKQHAVTTALARYLAPAEFAGVQGAFARLRAALAAHAGDISLADVAAAHEQF